MSDGDAARPGPGKLVFVGGLGRFFSDVAGRAVVFRVFRSESGLYTVTVREAGNGPELSTLGPFPTYAAAHAAQKAEVARLCGARALDVVRS